MKSLKLKNKKILDAFKVLAGAKYQHLSDDDKVRVWKITRLLKPIAIQYSDAVQDARTRLQPTDDFGERLLKAQDYERAVKADEVGTSMTKQEYDEFSIVFKDYISLLDKALKEEGDKESTLEFEPVSEEAFGKLMSSNDWSFGQAEVLDFIIE